MNFTNGDFVLRSQSFAEKSDLLRALQTTQSFELFEGTDVAQEFFLLSSRPRLGAEGPNLWLGICSIGMGSVPEVIFLPESPLIFVGFNQTVICVDSTVGITVRHDLPSLFSSFVRVPSFKVVLVFYEIGVWALDENGHVRWRKSTDLISDARFENGSVELLFSDGPAVSLDLGTGNTLEAHLEDAQS